MTREEWGVFCVLKLKEIGVGLLFIVMAVLFVFGFSILCMWFNVFHPVITAWAFAIVVGAVLLAGVGGIFCKISISIKEWLEDNVQKAKYIVAHRDNKHYN